MICFFCDAVELHRMYQAKPTVYNRNNFLTYAKVVGEIVFKSQMNKPLNLRDKKILDSTMKCSLHCNRIGTAQFRDWLTVTSKEIVDSLKEEKDAAAQRAKRIIG